MTDATIIGAAIVVSVYCIAYTLHFLPWREDKWQYRKRLGGHWELYKTRDVGDVWYQTDGNCFRGSDRGPMICEDWGPQKYRARFFKCMGNWS